MTDGIRAGLRGPARSAPSHSSFFAGGLVDPKILDIIRDDPRYAYEAYEFVCEAVTFTQERLGRVPEEDDDPDADYHVCGGELLRGACELAVHEFGMMAPVVFRQWGVRRTDDL